MYAIAVTVGHNASAIAIKDGVILGGYEEERFSRKKSDSSFPFNSIFELTKRFALPGDTAFCVSHWFPDGTLQLESKYWSTDTILSAFPNAKILSLTNDFTHHDAHLESARVFAGEDFADEYHALVIDGFGSHGECISIYKCVRSLKERAKLIHRIYGYKYSLGLFYQYATAFCGMQMHNHEYKMLAYETHINEVTGLNIEDVDDYITWFSAAMWRDSCTGGNKEESLSNLSETREFVNKTLSAYLKRFGFENADERTKRILVSYFAQRHLENIIRIISVGIGHNNLLVSGGVFMNVKINHMLCNSVPGKFCAMPLAGDQGAGLGVYQHYFGDLTWPGHVFWGHRTLWNIDLGEHDRIHVVKKSELIEVLTKFIGRDGFVNLVRGSMEFGPRALCNTSTLALPTKAIGAKINMINDRTNEMPFAMVMTKEQANTLFHNCDKVHKSLEYMIMARQFKENHAGMFAGGAHYYPLTRSYTCRPQITDDPIMVALLNRFGPLINTSWNYHGVPIVRSTADILYTHTMEQKQCGNKFKFETVIQED